MATRTRSNIGKGKKSKGMGIWDYLKKQTSRHYTTMTNARANPSGKGTKRKYKTPSAGYAGKPGKANRNPKVSGGAPKMGKAPAEKPKKTPGNKAKQVAVPKSGRPKFPKAGKFNFGAAIARGFGGQSAWEREKRKAGVKS